jgi:hypothetical protein
LNAAKSSFRCKSESSIFNTFCIPDQVRDDKMKRFSKVSILELLERPES